MHRIPNFITRNFHPRKASFSGPNSDNPAELGPDCMRGGGVGEVQISAA